MASIQRRSGKTGDRWRVMFRVQGKLRSETFLDPTGATEFSALVDRIGAEAAQEILRQRRGSPSAGRVPTVAEATADHVEHLSGITTGTRKDYKKIADLFATSRLGPLPVDVVTKDSVTAWVNSQTVAAKTIRNRHGLLYAAMERQVELGNIPANPCRGVQIGESERQEMVALTRAEFEAIIECLPTHWHPLVRTLVGTGLRFGEATALQVHDLDLGATPPQLRVARAWKFIRGEPPELGPPKTRKGRRVISLAPRLTARLREHIGDRTGDRLVFINTIGRPIRQNSFHEIWTQAIDDAQDAGGLDKRPRIHDLRHTHASWLLAKGVPLNIVQERLGHESITTTVNTYGHLAHDALSVAAQAAALDEDIPSLEEAIIDGEIVEDEG